MQQGFIYIGIYIYKTEPDIRFFWPQRREIIREKEGSKKWQKKYPDSCKKKPGFNETLTFDHALLSFLRALPRGEGERLNKWLGTRHGKKKKRTRTRRRHKKVMLVTPPSFPTSILFSLSPSPISKSWELALSSQSEENKTSCVLQYSRSPLFVTFSTITVTVKLWWQNFL